MITPQELEVWYILPAIRRELTISLKEEGLKQRQVAEILGVTEAAVSQYIKSKRAKAIKFNIGKNSIGAFSIGVALAPKICFTLLPN